MNNKSKKILFFMVSLQSGGGERVTTDLVNYFMECGKEVTLVVMDDRGFYASKISSRVHKIDLHTTKFLTALWCLRKIIRDTHPDVVFSSGIHTNVILLVASMLAMVKVRKIIRVGSPLTGIFKRYNSWKDRILIPLLTRIFYPKSTVIIAVSKGVADDIHSLIKDKGNIVTIYSPKNIEEIKNKSREYVPEIFTSSNGPFVVYVGRLVKEKDILTLIEAFKIAKESVQDLKLILVGDGSEKQGIEKVARRLGVDEDISYEGSQENPYTYMKHAHVLVLPSRSEGLSNVLIEALICGTKVVATDSPAGGSREILAPETDFRIRITDHVEKTKNGILTPVGEPKLMAGAIIEALSMETEEIDVTRFGRDNIMSQYERALFGDIVSDVPRH